MKPSGLNEGAGLRAAFARAAAPAAGPDDPLPLHRALIARIKEIDRHALSVRERKDKVTPLLAQAADMMLAGPETIPAILPLYIGNCSFLYEENGCGAAADRLAAVTEIYTRHLLARAAEDPDTVFSFSGPFVDLVLALDHNRAVDNRRTALVMEQAVTAVLAAGRADIVLDLWDGRGAGARVIDLRHNNHEPEFLAGLAPVLLAAAQRDMACLGLYDELVENAGPVLVAGLGAADAARMDAQRQKLVNDHVAGLWARQKEADNGNNGIVRADLRYLRTLARYRPDEDLLRAYADEAVGHMIDHGAVAALVDELYDENNRRFCLPELLTAERVAAIGAGLTDEAHEARRFAFARFMRAYGGAACDEALATDEMLRGLAPVVTMENGGAADLLATLWRVDHDDLAAAQADALQPVWRGLAAADAALPEVARDGRADIPMTADGLRGMARDIARLMNVVQTQRPVMVGSGMNLPDVMEGDDTPMRFGATNITGSTSPVLDGCGSGFSFLTAAAPVVRRTGGAVIREERLVAMPVITIDEKIWAQTEKYDGGQDIARAFQDAFEIFNHDYFHHLTARMIRPYFTSGSAISLRDDTAYGRLMGDEMTRRATRPGGRDVRAMGMEQFMRHQVEMYNAADDNRDKGDWARFAQGQANYEYHALTLHRVLYGAYLDRGEMGVRLRQAVDDYFDGVQNAAAAMAAGDGAAEKDRFAHYYANLMAFHVRRVVPHDHPVMQQLERRVDALGIDRDYARAMMNKHADRIIEEARGNDARLQAIARQVGVSHLDADLSVGEMVRWHGCRIAVNVLNQLYSPRYETARAQALPALRNILSAAARDLRTVEWRGGQEAADLYRVRQDRAAQAEELRTPLLRRDAAAPPSVS